MRLNTTFRIFGKMFLVHLQSMDIPKSPTRGMSARIPFTTEFALFMDYDNVKDERLIEELLYLQELYELGDFHVLATNEFGRHVVCVDRLTLKEALAVVYNSTCDAVFKRGIRINEYRTWILRTHEKGDRQRPKYLYSIKSKYNGQRLQSKAHALFLQKHYGAEARLTNPDGNTKLEFQDYKTSSKVNQKDVEKKTL
jgi:hypothetical protein